MISHILININAHGKWNFLRSFIEEKNVDKWVDACLYCTPRCQVITIMHALNFNSMYIIPQNWFCFEMGCQLLSSISILQDIFIDIAIKVTFFTISITEGWFNYCRKHWIFYYINLHLIILIAYITILGTKLSLLTFKSIWENFNVEL